MARPPRTNDGRTRTGIAQLVGQGDRLGRSGDDATRRLWDAEMVEQVTELVAILGQVDGVQVRAEQRVAGVHQRLGQVDRGLAAELGQDGRRLAVARVSFSSTSRTDSSSSGSKYRRLEASKSVLTVSGLELIMMLWTAWSRSDIAARTEQ